MLVKGDKIKLKEDIDSRLTQGMEFEVVDISPKMMIRFRSEIGYGLMSYSEFEEKFEKIQPPKRIWSNWVQNWDLTNGFYDWKHNGKTVKVKYKDQIGKATCHKDDEFSTSKGCRLALARAKVKAAEAHLRNVKAEL